ncbi:MAG: hypothetical protein IJE49_12830 [Agathobacter sp.]|nr:hypothetical protein [Agathobacter sp.]
MIQLEEKQFYVLLNFFYSQFFCEGLEKAMEDEEVSVVTTFRGMEYFLKLIKEHNIDFPYTTIKEYITETYDNGEEIYLRLWERYEEEMQYYSSKDKSFEEVFGKIEFNV